MKVSPFTISCSFGTPDLLHLKTANFKIFSSGQLINGWTIPIFLRQHGCRFLHVYIVTNINKYSYISGKTKLFNFSQCWGSQYRGKMCMCAWGYFFFSGKYKSQRVCQGWPGLVLQPKINIYIQAVIQNFGWKFRCGQYRTLTHFSVI